MRIACIHVPQFALQCATRLDPSLRGAAIAVVAAEPGRERPGPLHAPLVVACSRAAWAHGVRLGMTAAAARALGGELIVVALEPALEREAMRAIADALLGVTATVDLGGRLGAGGAHLAMYAELPAKTRGQAFGERVLALLDQLGVTGRIGIADDRFTAWVAAAHAGDGASEVVVVPRGGSAAFLAPRPLSLLAISPEVQHMLEALGVTTLGEFAALPAPSVARPFEADYQALARGDSGTRLRPYAPEAPIREDVVVTSGNVLDAAGTLGGPGAIATIARRIALRLTGRGRLAIRLEVSAGERAIDVPVEHAIGSAEELARVLAPVLDAAHAGPWRLRVAVVGEALIGDAAAEVTASRAAEPSMLDPLALVLSTAGSLFALAPPDLRAERRDAHRRTRRGKHRRTRPVALAQPRLFDRGSS